MRPFKVTFRVSGGFVPPPMPLHLDALLAYQRTRQHLPRLVRREEHTIESMRALGENLPLQRHEEAGLWCWKASAIMPAEAFVLGSRFYTQRRDEVLYSVKVAAGTVQHGRYVAGEPMKPYSMQIDTLRGVYRNLLGYYPLMGKSEWHKGEDEKRHLDLVAWGVGEIDKIRELLESGLITHLGQRRRAGHGRIESFTIEEDREAGELWKLRVRPWKMEDSDEPIQAAWKAPYWAAENRGQAYCPLALL